MANLSVKNLPKEVHRRLRERAKRNRRSLNSELVACLQDAVMPRRLDPDEAAERIRALRARFRGAPLRDRDVDRLKSEGRA
ncbi:MAG TPA: Arc family DNA-binding protein [Myxococcales bacterium]|jgi:plasmid stability protein